MMVPPMDAARPEAAVMPPRNPGDASVGHRPALAGMWGGFGSNGAATAAAFEVIESP